MRDAAFTDGEMAARIDAFDWASSPIGPRDQWSAALKASVDIALASRFPMILWWGPELVVLYNDAYIPIFAGKHPGALGARGLSTAAWGEPEVRTVIEPMLRGVLERGEATWSEDQLLILERRGFSEETYFTWSYSPVRDGDNIVGVFSAVSETTASVVQARRLRLLSELTAATIEAPSVQELCRRAAAVLAQHANDVPFHWTYLLTDGRAASLEGWSGVAGPRASDALNAMTALAVAGGGDVDLVSMGLDIPSQVWPEPVSRALLLPITGTGEQRMPGFMVVGLSPRLPHDEGYVAFFELLASRISSAIGDTRALEDERRRAEALAELDRSKSAFFSNVSHEFRTPLTLMLGPLQEALREGGDAPWDTQRERLETARGNGLRMLKLVNSLLDFSRLEAGRARASFTPTDLGMLTADLAAVFQSAFAAADLDFDVVIDVDTELVEVDVEMWETIVFNLLSNALKYTEAGSVRLQLRRSGDTFELEVTDTGIGIADDDVDHVFERFFRSTSRVGRSLEGTGIGLALVRELARLHGGDITVSSKLGQGSRFVLTLPRRVSDAGGSPVRTNDLSVRAESYLEEARRWLAAVDAPTPEADDDETPSDRARVLVVDDNADMRRYLAGLLGTDNDVALAPNGEAALELAAQYQPDVIVSDVMMPVLDGLGMLTRLRADPLLQHTPVLLLSARAGSEATLDGLESGADDYLVKPFSARELEARVRGLLVSSRRRTRDTAEQQALAEFRSMIAAAAAGLNEAETLDDVAATAYRALAAATPMVGATLSVRTSDGTHAEQYFGAELPVDIEARYRRTPLDIDTPHTRVILDGAPLFFDTAAQLRDSFPETATEFERLGIESAGVMPLVAPDGDVIGCLALGWSEPSHHDGARIEALLELADVTARAVARVQLSTREREIARTLQLGLLTAETRSTNVVMRTRYRSASNTLAVGGDWYDIVDLPDGRVGVAVGDVVGRGLPAATAMGQLRAALATAMIHDPDPVAAINMLDRFASHVPGARCATAVVAVVDSARQTVTYASAGHPPPLIVRPDEAAASLEGGRSWPLQVDTTQTRTEAATAPFPAGSLLFLYTDGLVERRGEALDVGLGRLATKLQEVAASPLLDLERAVMDHAASSGAGDDDIAFVALRSVVDAPATLVEVLPADFRELRGQRHRFSRWLGDAGLDRQRIDDMVLAVSEACANAIEHGSRNDARQVVGVEAIRHGDALTVAVSDSGQWRAGIEGFLTGRGRGHSLMEAFAESVQVHTDHQGSTVTLRFALSDEDVMP